LRLILLIIPLLLISACDSFIGNIPKNPELVGNGTNITEATLINVTNSTNSTEGDIVVVEESVFYSHIPSNISLFVMDVAGQAIVIQKGDKSLLIDSGTEADSTNILKNLRNLGVTTLDKIVVSNSREENIGGLPYIIIQTSPAMIYDSGISTQSSSYKLYRELFPNVTLIPSDKILTLDDAFVRLIVLYDDGDGFLDDNNDNSILVKITYESNEFLMMSNCGFLCIERAKNEPLESDVLILDGSCDSTTLTFLQKVNPRVVIATGEVCDETRNRFQFLNIPLYETSKHGDIRVRADGLDFSLQYEKRE